MHGVVTDDLLNAITVTQDTRIPEFDTAGTLAVSPLQKGTGSPIKKGTGTHHF